MVGLRLGKQVHQEPQMSAKLRDRLGSVGHGKTDVSGPFNNTIGPGTADPQERLSYFAQNTSFFSSLLSIRVKCDVLERKRAFSQLMRRM